MSSIQSICTREGIARRTYYQRVTNGWVPGTTFAPRTEIKADRLELEQAEINRALRKWRRV